MPFVSARNKLIYFIHIPKCAGTSVEAYLEARFGPVVFKDPKYYDVPARKRWCKSSPQHIPLEDLRRLIPLDFFDAMFAIVRHPVDRIASAYLFKREVEGQISSDMSLEAWLDYIEILRSRSPFALDNHIRPMVDFVPGKKGVAKVFRLEGGLIQPVKWLDAQVGDSEGPRRIRVRQSRAAWHAHQNLAAQEFKVSPAARARIHEMYAADFERFGYGIDDPTKY